MTFCAWLFLPGRRFSRFIHVFSCAYFIPLQNGWTLFHCIGKRNGIVSLLTHSDCSGCSEVCCLQRRAWAYLVPLLAFILHRGLWLAALSFKSPTSQKSNHDSLDSVFSMRLHRASIDTFLINLLSFQGHVSLYKARFYNEVCIRRVCTHISYKGKSHLSEVKRFCRWVLEFFDTDLWDLGLGK